MTRKERNLMLSLIFVLAYVPCQAMIGMLARGEGKCLR